MLVPNSKRTVDALFRIPIGNTTFSFFVIVSHIVPKKKYVRPLVYLLVFCNYSLDAPRLRICYQEIKSKVFRKDVFATV